MRWTAPLPGLLLPGVLLSGTLAALAGGPPPAPSFEEGVLRENGLAAEGDGLLEFFRDRTLSDALVREFEGHLARLGAAGYGTRERATAEVLRMGPAVRPLLLRAAAHPALDTETRRRVEHCLEKLPEGREALLATAAARLVARDRPAESAEVLLDYLPFAVSEAVRQEVQAALNALAADVPARGPLADALADPDPLKRAAAGEALVRGAGARHRAEVAPLRADKHPQVRYQVHLALVEAHDATALPGLIDALADVPPDQAYPALDVLSRIAGASLDAPDAGFTGRETPAQVRDAWRAWWADHGKHERLDLGKLLDRREQGYTVISSAGKAARGKVLALTPDGERLWEFGNVRYPVDVQVLGKSRVLVAEYLGRRVTERDGDGKVLWEKAILMPIACQRLPNGHTFIATRQMLLVVDRAGKEVFTGFRQTASIVAARRLPDGQMVAVTTGGVCHLLDPQGRAVTSFKLGSLYTMGSNIDVLPNGHVLAPLYKEDRVAEFDRTGAVRWQAPVPAPTSAVRLANGNTLVTSMREQRVIEITPEGKQVWSYRTDGRPWRARRW